MRQHRDAILLSAVLSCIVLFSGFVAKTPNASIHCVNDNISRHIAQLRSKEAQQKASAAHWLGQRGTAAQKAIPALVDLLGDETPVSPSQANGDGESSMTVGQEAAAALVNIGKSSTDALIHTLINSPKAYARENAAWALGALHRRQMI